MVDFFQANQINFLFGILFLLAYMLIYIYIPRQHAPGIRTPPELLVNDANVADPFRSDEPMNRRLEDFGRFNVRTSNYF